MTGRGVLASAGLAAGLCLLHFAAFDVRKQPLVWDARFYCYFAARVAAGDVPYRDFFDNKTPLAVLAGGALYQIGTRLGVDPVYTMRGGFLCFSAIAALLAFGVQRWLAGGRATPGLLGLLALLGFPLLGLLPSIGVLPKLLMATAAWATALCVARGRFRLAGAAGALAFLDWQIGALALLGALAAALSLRRGRWPALLQVAGGALAAWAPFVLYLAGVGGLGPACRQTLATMLVRGEGPWWMHRTLPERLAYLWDSVDVGCRGHQWLFALGIVGMGLFVIRLMRRWPHPQRPALICLAAYHYGVVGFSLYDYQSYGDLFILLHSVAFFAGFVFVEAWRQLAVALRRRAGARLWASRAAVLTTLLLVRPGPFQRELDLRPPSADRGATLDEQRAVARRVMAQVGERRLAALNASEVLMLSGRPSALPFVYWNSATYHFYRRSADEGYVQTLMRLARSQGVDTLIGDRTLLPRPGDKLVASETGAYSVVLRPIRRAGPTIQ